MVYLIRFDTLRRVGFSRGTAHIGCITEILRLTCVCGLTVSRYFLSIETMADLTITLANLTPGQIRGPSPNGKNENGWRVFCVSGENL